MVVTGRFFVADGERTTGTSACATDSVQPRAARGQAQGSMQALPSQSRSGRDDADCGSVRLHAMSHSDQGGQSGDPEAGSVRKKWTSYGVGAGVRDSGVCEVQPPLA